MRQKALTHRSNVQPTASHRSLLNSDPDDKNQFCASLAVRWQLLFYPIFAQKANRNIIAIGVTTNIFRLLRVKNDSNNPEHCHKSDHCQSRVTTTKISKFSNEFFQYSPLAINEKVKVINLLKLKLKLKLKLSSKR